MNRAIWTEQEIDTLRQVVARGDHPSVAASLLPGRTPNSCQQMAAKLNMCPTPRRVVAKPRPQDSDAGGRPLIRAASQRFGADGARVFGGRR